MADFTPKKVSGEAGKGLRSTSKVAGEDTQAPPRLYLEAHHLAKLGMDKMPPVGSKIKISGLAHVGASSEDDDPGIAGGKRRSMTLHMHKMDLGTDGPGKEVDQEAQSNKGAKSEMDKALSRAAGSESAKGKAKPKESTPRGGGDDGANG